MSTNQFRLTPKMINEKAFDLLSQYAVHTIPFDFALDSIKDALGPAYDEDEWMHLTQCILMDPGCFSEIEREFREQFTIQGVFL